MEDKKVKTYADCYQYKKYPQYGAILLDTIMKSDRIDKTVKEFEDVIYEVKRTKVNNDLIKVLTSKNTQLLVPLSPLPKPFKIFCAKDVKEAKNTIKVFIDCSNAITKDTNGYSVNEDVLVSYLINAEIAMIYTLKPSFLNRSKIIELATTCFANLYTHIIDYVGKISIIENARDKCLYLSARYFLTNVFMMDDEQNIRNIARKISGITELKENTYDFIINKKKDSDQFGDLKEFTNLVRNSFKMEKLTLDIVVEKWMYLYGQGTSFSLEYFPAFSAMLTDAYVGAYINNQKTIDKICGKDMVEYAKTIIYDMGI